MAEAWIFVSIGGGGEYKVDKGLVKGRLDRRSPCQGRAFWEQPWDLAFQGNPPA